MNNPQSIVVALMTTCLMATSQRDLFAEEGVAPPALTEIRITPAPPAVPALGYRLLPLSSELTPGDAAPIYLRIRHEILDESWRQIAERYESYQKLPLEKLPVREAHEFVEQWNSRLKLLEFGAHRESCDWSFTLPEQRLDAFGILLPDTQSMRQWGRLLVIKARVEIAEQKYGDAVRTLETGIALGRHVGNGPFLINALVGMAICRSIILPQITDLMGQPGSPNLYWALTALPRPLVSMRGAMETEQRLVENMIPEMAQVDSHHSRAEWTVILEKLYGRWRELGRQLSQESPQPPGLEALLTIDLPTFKRSELGSSRDYLLNIRQIPEADVGAMSDDEIVARAMAGRYRELRDETFKAFYLPWKEARKIAAETDTRLKAPKEGAQKVFAALMPPALSVLDAEVRLERHVTCLRIIEAIRAHAAEHGGQLPESLGQVAALPVPEDPATGLPFEYRREGASATLSTPKADLKEPPAYRITIRDGSEKRP